MKPQSKLFRWSLLLLIAVASSGCSMVPKAPAAVLLEQPLEPEPLAVPHRTEIAIARISELLRQAQLSPTQKARLHYDRGVMFDGAGLAVLARYDFMQALQLQPDMADAYNFLGIQATLNADYDQAYEAFDSALELQKDYQYVYLNRAIALQYDGKMDLAVKDFRQFQAIDPTDPYRALWRFQAEVQQDKAVALQQLASDQPKLNDKQWASKIVAFYLGQISEAALLQVAVTDPNNPQQLAEQLCEVYFYLAKWHSLHNNPSQAVLYYKKALATNVYEFVEHRYARIEISRLRQAVVAAGDTH